MLSRTNRTLPIGFSRMSLSSAALESCWNAEPLRFVKAKLHGRCWMALGRGLWWLIAYATCPSGLLTWGFVSYPTQRTKEAIFNPRSSSETGRSYFFFYKGIAKSSLRRPWPRKEYCDFHPANGWPKGVGIVHKLKCETSLAWVKTLQ